MLDLARANGQIATTDPLVMRTLQAIQASPQSTGSMTPASDPLLQSYFFLNSGYQRENGSRRSGSTTTSATSID